MRIGFEFLVFTAIAALAIGVVFSLALVFGSPFDIRPSQAAAVGFVAVVFWFPAFANIHVFVTRRGGEPLRNRVCAGFRAFGLLLCSAALGAGFFFADVSIRVAIPVFVAGCILNFGTILFEK